MQTIKHECINADNIQSKNENAIAKDKCLTTEINTKMQTT